MSGLLAWSEFEGQKQEALVEANVLQVSALWGHSMLFGASTIPNLTQIYDACAVQIVGRELRMAR